MLTLTLTVTSTRLTPVLHAQAAGQLDPTFAAGGKAIVDLGASLFEDAFAVAVQPDGKILIAGNTLGKPAVVRFNVDGTLDSGFGTGGIAKAAFPLDMEATAMFLELGGKILVAGLTNVPGPNGVDAHFALVRFNADGSLDPTFGIGGQVTSFLGFVQNSQSPSITLAFTLTAVARQLDGSFLVNGTKQLFFSDLPPITSLFLARYAPVDASGTGLDANFGDAGVVTTTVGQSRRTEALLFQPDDGKIVEIGSAVVAGSRNMALVRYTTTGALDQSFGDGGLVTTDLQGVDSASAGVLLADGTILVAGNAGDDVALVRYLPDGSRDNSFDGDGKVITDVNGNVDQAKAIVVQPDGRVVIVGSTIPAGQANGDFLVARYNADGSLDSTFGTGGVAVTDFRGSDVAFAVALQDDGKILAAGVADLVQPDFAVARYERGAQADLTIAKVGPAAPVDVGQQFAYTLTVGNQGPDAAANVVIRDQLPAGVTFVSCETTSDGVCGAEGGTRTITFSAIAAGETRTATLRGALSATVPDGTAISNTAAVSSEAVDPDPASNTATATIVARAIPHTLRFFLHGFDAPGTAGGFTMNLTPAPAQALALNLRNAPTWFSDPSLTGTVGTGATFRIVRPCTLGLSVGATYRLAKTDLAGGAAQTLGQTQRFLAPCIGQEVVSIPVAAPVAFANERLRLTISSAVNVNLDLRLGEGTFFEITNFAGVP